MNKVNDSYNIYDLGFHNQVRKNLRKYYKSFGIKQLKYEPSLIDSGEAKFVYVRQKYSRDLGLSMKKKHLVECDFDLNKFYGK